MVDSKNIIIGCLIALSVILLIVVIVMSLRKCPKVTQESCLNLCEKTSTSSVTKDTEPITSTSTGKTTVENTGKTEKDIKTDIQTDGTPTEFTSESTATSKRQTEGGTTRTTEVTRTVS